MHVTAHITRSGRWWAIEVPDVPGLHTQARRRDQIEAMVIDAGAALGIEITEVTVVEGA